MFREVQILQDLHHSKIVNLIEPLKDEVHVYLVMDYVANGDLFYKIVNKKKLNEIEWQYVFRQLVDWVEYTHGKGIVHRDLKPENILVEREITIKDNDIDSTFYDVKV